MNTLIYISAALVAVVALVVNVPHRNLEWDSKVVPMARSYVGLHNQTQTPLTGKVAVITGATSGIGLSLIKMLSRLGATVVALGRSPNKLANLKSEIPSVETILVDLVDLESVAKAAKEIMASHDRIDFLVNNGGIHDGFKNLLGTFESAQGYDQVFGVNYLSHFLLTEKLSTALMNSTSPTILQLSSSYHWVVDGSDLIPVGGNPPVASMKGGSHGFLVFRSTRSYANSKLAQILHARALKRHHPLLSKARIVSACPAWVNTQIAGEDGLFKFVLEKASYDVDGWGLASTMLALFDSQNSKADYYVNTLVFDLGPYIMAFQNNLMYRIGIRDLVGSVLAFSALFLERLFPESKPGHSSPAARDEVLGDALYDWSMNAVKEYL